jgi:hypothetical protein
LLALIGFGVVYIAEQEFRLQGEPLRVLTAFVFSIVAVAVALLDVWYKKRANQKRVRDLPPAPEVSAKEKELPSPDPNKMHPVRKLTYILLIAGLVLLGPVLLYVADQMFMQLDEPENLLIIILLVIFAAAMLVANLIERDEKLRDQKRVRDLPPPAPEVPAEVESPASPPKVRVPARTPAPRWVVTSGQIRVSDFGILVYSRGSDKPLFARQALIPTRADTIRPFAKIYVGPPFQPHTMRFLITDQHGKERFRSEKSFGLGDAQMTILSPKRLHLGPHLKLTSDSTWMLTVELNGETIARQDVAWYDPRKAYESGSHLITDGELAVEVESFVDNVVLIPTSLDELLRGDSGHPDADLR